MRWLVFVGLLGCSSSPGVFGSETSTVAVGSGGADAGGGSGAAAGGGAVGAGTAGMGGAGGQGGSCVPRACEAWECGDALDDGCGGELDCSANVCSVGGGYPFCGPMGVCTCDAQGQGSTGWNSCNADPNSPSAEWCGLMPGQFGNCTAMYCGATPNESAIPPNCAPFPSINGGDDFYCCQT